MATEDELSPAKLLTTSCDCPDGFSFRLNLLRGILCIEIAPRTPIWMFLWCFDYLDYCSSLMVFQIFRCSHTLFSTAGGDFLVGGTGSIESGCWRLRMVLPLTAEGMLFSSLACACLEVCQSFRCTLLSTSDVFVGGYGSMESGE
nr:hypothetical protein Iba_chr15dCG5190 [Ipomoea batatas]